MNKENKEATAQNSRNSMSLDGRRLAKLEAINADLLAALERSEEGLRCLLDEVALLRAGANPEPQSDSIRTYALIQARAAIARATGA